MSAVSMVSFVFMVSGNVLGLRTWFLDACSVCGVHGVCQCPWLLYRFVGALGACGAGSVVPWASVVSIVSVSVLGFCTGTVVSAVSMVSALGVCGSMVSGSVF